MNGRFDKPTASLARRHSAVHLWLRWVTIVVDIWQVSLDATPVLASIIAATAQMILVNVCRVLLGACYDLAPVVNDLADEVI